MKLINGNAHSDHRGSVRFVNDFDFENVVRFYVISHPDTSVIRAWQGHQKETKYFFVVKGSFRLCWIKIENWDIPCRESPIESMILNDQKIEIFVLNPGFVNGFQALEADSILMVYSDKTLEESKEDDFRWPPEYFNDTSNHFIL
jgi:dTDP-4-dehydrorhamnose 3,5-epimerase